MFPTAEEPNRCGRHGGRERMSWVRPSKPSPISIQAHAEPGGLFDPLYSDIVAARDNAPQQPLPSPSQIANERQGG